MSKIKEGEYIRTYEGIIYKANSVAEGLDGNVFIKDSLIYTDEIAILRGEIKAHSKNIIDLIEVGDIIQYKELKKLNCGTSVGQKYVGNIADKEELEEVKKEIQTKGIELVGIVTKEQFNSVMYKVGDIE